MTTPNDLQSKLDSAELRAKTWKSEYEREAKAAREGRVEVSRLRARLRELGEEVGPPESLSLDELARQCDEAGVRLRIDQEKLDRIAKDPNWPPAPEAWGLRLTVACCDCGAAYQNTHRKSCPIGRDPARSVVVRDDDCMSDPEPASEPRAVDSCLACERHKDGFDEPCWVHGADGAAQEDS